MLYEYAIDPIAMVEIARDRRDFRLFLRSFEVGNPRVVSNFPKFSRLKKQIESHADSVGLEGIDSTRLDELLSFLRQLPKVVRPSDADGDSWVDKVRSEGGRVAFDTVFVSDKALLEPWPSVSIDDCYQGNCPFWDFNDRVVVSKTASAIASAIANMLRLSTRIYIIDPYLGTQKDKWSTFISVLEKAVSGRVADDLEVTVYLAPCKGITTPSEMKKHFEKTAAEQFSSIKRMQFIGLKEKRDGEQFHNRYILTDIGGISLGAGFEDGGPSETDDLFLLSREQYSDRLVKYTQRGTYQKDGKATVVFPR